ncbi:hypothetical protein HCH_02251 [Hahella chejuensis KCTC 2396]|uniref:Uncharacterized protein n=1 Tax=Hahella chejuensis (strain KCTC 2396) TaxID=349521 RepID=Q2SJU7_HAHCH|nr:hypothetical protein HCH_02251 [Hahella chejuensis KCTC 2396]
MLARRILKWKKRLGQASKEELQGEDHTLVKWNGASA